MTKTYRRKFRLPTIQCVGDDGKPCGPPVYFMDEARVDPGFPCHENGKIYASSKWRRSKPEAHRYQYLKIPQIHPLEKHRTPDFRCTLRHYPPRGLGDTLNNRRIVSVKPVKIDGEWYWEYECK